MFRRSFRRNQDRFNNNSNNSDAASDPAQFQNQVQTLIPAEVRMISGCHSEQTSADVSNVQSVAHLPNPAGRAGGACTSALLELLYQHKRAGISFQSLLLKLRESLAQKGMDQIPQLSSSRPLELQQTPFSLAPPSPSGERRALLVGINYRGQSGELSGCHNDVLNMKRYLIQEQGFEERHILILMDDGGRHIFPTRQKIILGLQQLVAHSQPGDSVYFHYSGHGGLLSADGFNAFKASLSSDAAKQYDETIYPVDHEQSGQIRDFSLFSHFVRPMKAGVTVTCVVDCCHSGTVLDLPYQFQPTPTGDIRMRSNMDSLSNLAFLYLLAGGGPHLLPMGFDNVAHHMQHSMGNDTSLEDYHGTGVEELYNADRMDDAEFTSNVEQYYPTETEGADNNYGEGTDFGEAGGGEDFPQQEDDEQGDDAVDLAGGDELVTGDNAQFVDASDGYPAAAEEAPVMVQGMDAGYYGGDFGDAYGAGVVDRDYGHQDSEDAAAAWNIVDAGEAGGGGGGDDDDGGCCESLTDVLGAILEAGEDE